VGTGNIAEAAILGLAGGIWAISPNFKLSDAEQATIRTAFDKNKHEQTQSKGIVAAGQKYFTLQVDERSIYGKKMADGIICVKTKLAVLVAVYKAPKQAAEATPVVEGLADYLIGLGY